MSCIFMGRKKLNTEKNHICGIAAVPENLILFFFSVRRGGGVVLKY